MNLDYARVIKLQNMPTGGSDLVLKQDVTSLKNVLHKVTALRPVTWRWKSSHEDKSVQYGFIAQEVEELFPDIVKNGRWHGTDAKVMSTHDLVPYAIEAIKEQNFQLKAAHREIALLKKMITELQNKLT